MKSSTFGIMAAALAVTAVGAVALTPQASMAEGIMKAPPSYQIATAGTVNKNCVQMQVAKANGTSAPDDGNKQMATPVASAKQQVASAADIGTAMIGHAGAS